MNALTVKPDQVPFLDCEKSAVPIRKKQLLIPFHLVKPARASERLVLGQNTFGL